MGETDAIGVQVEVDGIKVYKFDVLGETFYMNVNRIATQKDGDVRVYVRVGSAFLSDLQKKVGVKAVHSTKQLRSHYASQNGIDHQRLPAAFTRKPEVAVTVTPVAAAADKTIIEAMAAEWKELSEAIGDKPNKAKVFEMIETFHKGNVPMQTFLIDMYLAKFPEVKKNKYA